MKAKRASVPARQPRQPRQRKGTRWGQAHEQRGLGFADHAVDFIQREQFQINKKPSNDDLDAWFEERGLLQVPIEKDTTSDAWKAHVQRRNILIKKLRKAGRHPRMTKESHLPSFNLVSLGSDRWHVQSLETVITDRELLRLINAYIETRKRDLDQILQGIDFTQHPSHFLSLAETFYDDIELLKMMASQHVTSINQKLSRFQQQVERSISLGQAHLMLPKL